MRFVLRTRPSLFWTHITQALCCATYPSTKSNVGGYEKMYSNANLALSTSFPRLSYYVNSKSLHGIREMFISGFDFDIYIFIY